MKVLLTGGTGFLGFAIKTAAPSEWDLLAPTRAELNLLNEEKVNSYIYDKQPDMIIHAAGSTDGVEGMACKKQDHFYTNLDMGINLIQSCDTNTHFVYIGTACSLPFDKSEASDLWNGPPHSANRAYGLAKRIHHEALRISGNTFSYLILANLYGPGDVSTHAIPMLIQRFLAGGNEVWGCPCTSRSFLYIDDAVKGILAAAESRLEGTYVVAPLDSEYMGSVAKAIALATGLPIPLEWTGENIGQDYRQPDGDEFMDKTGWQPEVSFEVGIVRTVNWWRNQRREE